MDDWHITLLLKGGPDIDRCWAKGPWTDDPMVGASSTGRWSML